MLGHNVIEFCEFQECEPRQPFNEAKLSSFYPIAHCRHVQPFVRDSAKLPAACHSIPRFGREAALRCELRDRLTLRRDENSVIDSTGTTEFYQAPVGTTEFYQAPVGTTEF